MWGLQKTIAGVDGCKGGWIAVTLRPNERPFAATYETFASLIHALPDDAIIAVDMPIGFKHKNDKDGRGPEPLIRNILKPSASSVFDMPSREAVYAELGESRKSVDMLAAHQRACIVARRTSDPPRAFGYQGFCLLRKVREIDALLKASMPLRRRVIESHPEVAFWQMNGRIPVTERKKVKKKINPAGMAERRGLLIGAGLPSEFLAMKAPPKSKEDDFLDACAMLVVAARHARGETISFPRARETDSYGIEIAIWA